MTKMQKLASPIFAALMLGIVAMLIIPLPPVFLDILLAIDLVFAGIVLVVSISIADPLEFAAFAPILLVATLFRLALDVSATRLILSNGADADGVGSLIPAFGAFVVRGNIVVGLIMFLILVTIQFVVIASGSGRVAEVAARFTLDALPGKQMAIDAELHAGSINLEMSKVRRKHVQREADFFGAMDGAGKFIKGDAVAALVIVSLEIVGGIIVGCVYHGMSIADAFSRYTLLAIGNALLTTLPAFLMSTAMGLLVTRVSADGSLGADVAAQLFARPDALRIVGGFALLLALVPALPHLAFLGLAIAAFLGAQRAARAQASRASDSKVARERATRASLRRPESALARIGVDTLAIDFGADVLPIVNGAVGEALLDRIGEIRRMLASEIGIILPGVRLRDDPSLRADCYRIRVRDEIVAEAGLRLDCLVAVADDAVLDRIVGEPTIEAVYKLKAKYIEPAHRSRAIAAGALVFDPISVLGSHLAEIARSRAAALVGRQEIQTMIEHVRGRAPSVIKEIGTERLPLTTVVRVFAGLLRERVWPRDTVLALETLCDAAGLMSDETLLIERVRAVLVPAQLRARAVSNIDACLIGPEFETMFGSARDGTLVDPRALHALREDITEYLRLVRRIDAAVICASSIRRHIAEFLARSGLDVAVYAFSELPAHVTITATRVCHPTVVEANSLLPA